jgi:nitrate reductase gamma subunit
VDWLLGFARGPLFRFAFAVMVLGLLRHLVLTLWQLRRTYARAGDKNVPKGAIWQRTVSWLFPVRNVFRKRPVYGVTSVLFHIGLILVPILLFNHIRLWETSVGISWFALALNRHLADVLTAIVIAGCTLLIIGRLSNPASRFLSHSSDYTPLVLLLVCFLAGFLASHPGVSPLPYKTAMLFHVLAADLVILSVPFTKLTHCVLFPLSFFVSDAGWRFPADSGVAVEATLGKKGQPI